MLLAGVHFGYHCEECEEAVWPATTRSELAWLRDRRHVVKEVAAHLSGGVDGWMEEGLQFLEAHAGHRVVLVRRG